MKRAIITKHISQGKKKKKKKREEERKQLQQHEEPIKAFFYSLSTRPICPLYCKKCLCDRQKRLSWKYRKRQTIWRETRKKPLSARKRFQLSPIISVSSSSLGGRSMMTITAMRTRARPVTISAVTPAPTVMVESAIAVIRSCDC